MKAIPSYTKATIRKGRTRAGGEIDVLIYYHHKNTEYFGTQVEILPKYWNKSHAEVKDTIPEGNSIELNEKIYKAKNQLDQLVHDYKKQNYKLPTGEELRSLYISSRIPVRKVMDETRIFISYEFERWIDYKENHQRVSESSLKVYNQTLNYLKVFVGFKERSYDYSSEFIIDHQETKFIFKTLKDVNLEFIEKFRNWLGDQKSKQTKESLSNVTINKQIRNILSFLKERSKAGVEIDAGVFNVKLDKNFAKRQHLTEGEIQSIINLDIAQIPEIELSEDRKKTLRFVKDVFEFNLWFGLRVSDLFDIQKSDIFISDLEKENYLLFWTHKTNQSVKLPIITDSVKVITKKYLEIGDQDFLFPRLSVKAYNDYLRLLAKYAGITQEVSHPIFSNGKRVARKIPKWELISSHSIRKTSINKNILDHSREVAKYMSTHQSESGFKPYEDMTDYDRIFDKITNK